MKSWFVGVVVGLVSLSTFAVPRVTATSGLPDGSWACLIYGADNEAQPMLLRVDKGRVELASPGSEVPPRYRRARNTVFRDGGLSFSDRERRRFEGVMDDSEALSGSWRRQEENGSWWCAPSSGRVTEIAPEGERRRSLPNVSMPAPAQMRVPRYPRTAIREALEGRVVVCFKVDPEGQIKEPRIVERSHPIFEAPALDALNHSYYKPWDRESEPVDRPACRTYRFELDPNY